jgi:hypothetical protein
MSIMPSAIRRGVFQDIPIGYYRYQAPYTVALPTSPEIRCGEELPALNNRAKKYLVRLIPILPKQYSTPAQS